MPTSLSRWRRRVAAAIACLSVFACAALQGQEAPSLIPIRFTLDKPGYVTLVIEDSDGKRIRNLISQESYEAGEHTVWWDGLDDRDRDAEAAKHAVFHIPGKIVEPGAYTVRGLVHDGVDLIYRMTPYTNGNPPWRTEDHGSQWLTNHSAPSDVVFLPAGAAPEREGKPSSAGAQVLICSRVAEGGSGLAWVDLSGQKLWGQHWLGGVWTAASHLAVDRGENPVAGTYAYAAATWPGDKYNDFKSELRLHRLVDPELRREAPRDKRFGTGEDRPVLEPTYAVDVPGMPNRDDFANVYDWREARKPFIAELRGLAVHDGLIVAALSNVNELVFIDGHQGRALGTVTIDDPQGLAFGPAGRLHVLSGDTLLRYALDLDAPQTLGQPETLATKLDEPRGIHVAADGRIFVSQQGDSHQVLVLAADGRETGRIGDPGRPSLGTYNPNHMNHPAGLALDDRGRLWVTENTHTPKRVSVWNLSDGSLADAFYGPMRYGGSGAVDPVDPSRFFYDDDHGGSIEFTLDYETGKSAPAAILYLDEYNETGLTGRYVGAAPSYPIHHAGHLYLTDAYNLHTTGRRSATLWRVDDDGIARIVAAAGDILDSRRRVMPAFQTDAMKAAMPAGFEPADDRHLFFVWSDANGDQKPQPAEVQFLDPKDLQAADDRGKPRMGTVSTNPGLVFAISQIGDVVMGLTPTRVDEKGVPYYDLGEREILATGAQSPASSGHNQVLTADDGWTITTTPVKPFAREGLGGVRNGEAVWYYPSLWPGLHASHIAPMPEGPGQVIGTTRVIGNVIDAPPGSEAKQLWAINANKGTIYVFTTDGLFVARLFQDSRTTSWNAPEAIRGMNVNHLSLQEECFGPTWTRLDDGRVMLQAHFVGNIVEVQGLQTIRRLPDQGITVSTQQLADAQAYTIERELQRQAAAAEQAKPMEARILTEPITVDGQTLDWVGSRWVQIDKRLQKVGNWGKQEVPTLASVAVHGDTLYLAWQTYDQKLLRSSGENLNNLFKTGGALDIVIGVDPGADPQRREAVAGDQRLLVTQVDGKTTAVLYEPVAPDHTGPTIEFGSPLRTLQFDRVEVVSDRVVLAASANPDLTKDKDGSVVLSVYELAVPLDLLHFTPKAGETYRFDIGMLRGDGSQTLQRVYWHNKRQGMVSDIPSEAELLPALWGQIRFVADQTK